MVKSGIYLHGVRTAFVDKLPKCDFCKKSAKYDGVMAGGHWAFMCYVHFSQYGIGLGTVIGQRLVTYEEAGLMHSASKEKEINANATR
jgi:hypothetical protein